MKNRLSIIVLGLFLGSFLSAAWAQQVQSMKLLTPQIGWARSGQHLYWTTDNGVHWKDIAPPKSPKENIGGVFFLDTSNGWVLLSYPDEKDEQQFRVASTSDSGANWSSSPMKLPWKRYAEDFAGGGELFFLDKAHGWVDLDLYSGSSSAPARLLATQDGGVTWEATSDDPSRAGSFCFFSEKDGVLAGGLGHGELYVTHDGSKSWQELSLKAPPEAAPADFPTYGKPVCGNGKDGFLAVTYTPTEYYKTFTSVLVLFATSDGGRTWRQETMQSGLEERSAGEGVAAAIVGSELIIAPRVTGGKTLDLMTIPSRGESSARTTLVSGLESVLVSQLSFVSESNGWASVGSGLLSTTDAGVTWKDISPWPPAHARAYRGLAPTRPRPPARPLSPPIRGWPTFASFAKVGMVK